MDYKNGLFILLSIFTLGATPSLARDPERVDVRFAKTAAAPAWNARAVTLAAGSLVSASASEGAAFAVDALEDGAHLRYSFRADALEYDFCGSGTGQLKVGARILKAGECVSVGADAIRSVLEAGLAARGEFVLSVSAYY